MFATQICLRLRVKHNRARKPADGNQAEQFDFAGLELENRDGVLRAVADEKFSAGFVERQRVRLRAEQIARILPRANRLHDFVRARVNHTQRVAARIGDDEKFSVGRKRQRARVQAGDNFTFDLCHPNQSPTPSLRWRWNGHPRAPVCRDPPGR